MDIISTLPAVEAILNSISATLVTTGYYFIHKNNIPAHQICMKSALFTSTIFAVVYLIYHLNIGNIPFAGQGYIRPIYFLILISHVILAITTVVLVLTTVYMIIKGETDKHKKIARWTVPVWLYVSVTGVIIYLLAFHFYPPTD
ncbi:MAG: DUF420 domain-containing protein [Gammaproteobacteria bacterium]|nr:DUF420 domain-containing protein [Gammaproteobacteria bacterium]